jgi:23S rRNA (uridine2552-2'-O)-methyltransferase
MPTRWYKERKGEHYYREAKKLGYRARSAFKLKQIQEKYKIMKRGDAVIDLGSSPGGWSQVAKEIVGNGAMVAVDIKKMEPIHNVRFIQGDVTNEETIAELKKIGKIDVVLSDLSPDISGNYSLDHSRSIWLCEMALNLAKILLKKNGNFCCKVFQGNEFDKFFEEVRLNFDVAKIFVPPATRKRSSEVYVIGKRFKG